MLSHSPNTRWVLLEGATRMALTYHQNQLRKGSSVPYMSHLFSVTGISIQHGADDPVAAAAMLHDAAEDQGGEDVLAEIGRQLDPKVAILVRELSDSLTTPKPPWRERKLRTLAEVRSMSPPHAWSRRLTHCTTCAPCISNTTSKAGLSGTSSAAAATVRDGSTRHSAMHSYRESQTRSRLRSERP